MKSTTTSLMALTSILGQASAHPMLDVNVVPRAAAQAPAVHQLPPLSNWGGQGQHPDASLLDHDLFYWGQTGKCPNGAVPLAGWKANSD